MTSKILLLSETEEVKTIEALSGLKRSMTSDNSPLPLVSSASSINSAPFSAWKAFDGLKETGWATVSGTIKAWLKIDFGESKKVGSFSIVARLAGTEPQQPKKFNFEGSNNGVDFSVITTIANQINWMASEERAYDLDSIVNYRYYRVNIDENNGGAFTSLAQIKFNEIQKALTTVIPSQSEQSFINHGMSQSELASIDMSADFTEKHYIQDVSTVLGSGKVFEQVLDVSKVLKKISIK